MASFDRYSNFNSKASVSSVVFGSEKPLLEVELNEVQDIQNNKIRRITRELLGDGITDLDSIHYSNGKVVIDPECYLVVNGYLIKSTGLEVALTDGTAYLVVDESIETYGQVLKEEGNKQSSKTVSNYFKDSRTPVETTRRKVVKYDLYTTVPHGSSFITIATVKNGIMTKVCPEVNLLKLSNQVMDLRVQLGTLDEGVLGVEVDLTTNTIKRYGDNKYWSTEKEYNTSPIYGDRKRCNVTDKGEIIAFYGDSGYTETGALTEQIIDAKGDTHPIGTKVQCMVLQPKYYYKRIPIKVERQVDSKYKVEGYHMLKWIDLISPTPREGFKLHPAFIEIDGNVTHERDFYLIGENEGCLESPEGVYDLNDNTQVLGSHPYEGIKFSSIAGAKPASGASVNAKNNSLTRNAVRSVCKNRGIGWHQLDFVITSSEQLLFTVEYSAFNIQNEKTFGAGITNLPYVSNVNDSVPNAENTTLGNGSGFIPISYVHSNGTTYEVKMPVYRGVKNPFGNIYKFVDGFMRNYQSVGQVSVEGHSGTSTTNFEYSGNNVACWQNDFNNYSDEITKYKSCGFSCATENGYAKAFGYSEDCDFAFVTSKVGGDSSRPVGDYYYTNMDSPNQYIALLGSHWNNGATTGLFCWLLNNVASSRYCHIGGRLCRRGESIIKATQH